MTDQFLLWIFCVLLSRSSLVFDCALINNKNEALLSGDAHARRPLHKMDGVFFKAATRMRVDRFIKWTVLFLSGDAHARRPLHKRDGVFFFFRFVGQLLEHPVWRHLQLPAH